MEANRKRPGSANDQKISPVVTGETRTGKDTGVYHVMSVLFGKDPSSMKGDILEILVPALKRTADDLLTYIKDMYLYGETRSNKRGVPASRVSYRSYYDDRRDDRRDSNRHRQRATYDYTEITYNNYGDAKEVLDGMRNIIQNYDGFVNVAEMKQLSNVAVENNTDHKFGWTNLDDVKPRPIRDGRWVLDLPRAVPLD